MVALHATYSITPLSTTMAERISFKNRARCNWRDVLTERERKGGWRSWSRTSYLTLICCYEQDNSIGRIVHNSSLGLPPSNSTFEWTLREFKPRRRFCSYVSSCCKDSGTDLRGGEMVCTKSFSFSPHTIASSPSRISFSPSTYALLLDGMGAFQTEQ